MYPLFYKNNFIKTMKNKNNAETENLNLQFSICVDRYAWAILEISKTFFFGLGKLDTIFMKVLLVCSKKIPIILKMGQKQDQSKNNLSLKL